MNDRVRKETKKYIVLIGDGMAGRPIEELGFSTTLKHAFTPHMDQLAQRGMVGKVRTIPKGFHPGSDVANLSILGYDPSRYYTGRAPLEAASIGIRLGEDDVAYRCNLVTLRFSNGKSQAVMDDYSSGHISTDEARELISTINAELKSGDVVLRDLMKRSVDLLDGHPVNRRRLREGKKPANSIWLWGQGKRPELPTYQEKYGIRGALISEVDLTKGLGIYAGFQILKVPGATGWLDTNYTGKAEYALQALSDSDLVYVHVESPDEAGHSGNYREKIQAIEDFDALVVGKILKGLEERSMNYRVLLMPDHATPVKMRTHTDEPVPFVIFDSRIEKMNEGISYDETILERADIIAFEEGYKLMDFFIREGVQ